MTASSDRPEYVAGNVAIWTKSNAEYTDATAEREIGIWFPDGLA